MIVFEDVAKRYAGGYTALAGVSFEIRHGELVVLSGHSGAGKSTLFKLIPVIERPTAGRVLINGQDVSHLPRTAIVQHGARGAEPARNAVGRPGTESRFVHIGEAGDLENGIPELALFLRELLDNRAKRLVAGPHVTVITRAGQPDAALQNASSLSRRAECHECRRSAQRHGQSQLAKCREKVAHEAVRRNPGMMLRGRCREAATRSSAARQHSAANPGQSMPPFFP